MKDQLQTRINILFLKLIEKAAYTVKVPEKGYVWKAEYIDNYVKLTYTNGEISNSCYIDFIERKCINGDTNHNIMVCKVTEAVLNIINDTID